MVSACIGLGANLGDAVATLRAACQALDALPGSHVAARSALYRSTPVQASGPDYVNAALRLETLLAPHALLDALQQIEGAHGRQRPYANAPRTLDLDLLLYGDRHVADARLTVPHPRLAERAFVLLPLLDVLPGFRLPDGRDAGATAAMLAARQGIRRLDGIAFASSED